MACRITDVIALLDNQSNLVPQNNQHVYLYPARLPIFVKVGVAWLEIGIKPIRITLTDAGGIWTAVLPWPSETDPATAEWVIQLPDGSRWRGLIPEAVAGPLTLHDLTANHGWQLVTPVSAVDLPLIVYGPSGPPGITWHGDYNDHTAYKPNDIVNFSVNAINGSYICIQQTVPGIDPLQTAYWQSFGSAMGSLADTGVVPGTYGSVTQSTFISVDSKGRLTAATSQPIQISESQVTGLVTDLAAKADAAIAVPNTRSVSAGAGTIGGGNLTIDRVIGIDYTQSPTWTGAHQFSQSITGQAPTQPAHLATKAYADALIQAVSAKMSVYAASTTNVATLAGLPTLDGVAVPANHRVLLIGQTIGAQNGIWVVATGNWNRATDFLSGASASGAFAVVERGATHGATSWVCTNDFGSDVIDTNALTFSQVGGAVAGVTSVSNTDGTLIITPTSGDVFAALNLAHPNTWTGVQTFTNPVLNSPTLSGTLQASGDVNFKKDSGVGKNIHIGSQDLNTYFSIIEYAAGAYALNLVDGGLAFGMDSANFNFSGGNSIRYNGSWQYGIALGHAVSGAANVDVGAGYDNYIGVTNTSAPRTVTLPSVPARGHLIAIVDESNGAGTNNITIAPHAGHTITDGSATGLTSVTIATNGGGVLLLFDGTDKWFVVSKYGQASTSTPALWIYGSGADGTATISGTVTLARDMYYDVLTITAGATLCTLNYRVFAKTSITNNGTINYWSGLSANVQNGGNGSGSSRGGGGSANLNNVATLPPPMSGVLGSNGITGIQSSTNTVSNNLAFLHAESTWISGAGGSGASGAGQAGIRTPNSNNTPVSTQQHLQPIPICAPQTLTTNPYMTALPGTGGAAGTGDGTNQGGGGGGGGASGPCIALYAPTVINNGTIDIRGGNGGNGGSPTVGNCGGGGGGAGGSGGVLHVISNHGLSGTGTVNKAGGTGGNGGAGVGTGTAGTAGQNGPAGALAVHALLDGTLTVS